MCYSNDSTVNWFLSAPLNALHMDDSLPLVPVGKELVAAEVVCGLFKFPAIPAEFAFGFGLEVVPTLPFFDQVGRRGRLIDSREHSSLPLRI